MPIPSLPVSAKRRWLPPGAYNKDVGQFILPYEAVRTAAAPDQVLLQFLQSSYEACADNAKWDRRALERQLTVKHESRRRAALIRCSMLSRCVAPGLDPGAHPFRKECLRSGWMPGSSPGMTWRGRGWPFPQRRRLASILSQIIAATSGPPSAFTARMPVGDVTLISVR